MSLASDKTPSVIMFTGTSKEAQEHLPPNHDEQVLLITFRNIAPDEREEFTENLVNLTSSMLAQLREQQDRAAL